MTLHTNYTWMKHQEEANLCIAEVARRANVGETTIRRWEQIHGLNFTRMSRTEASLLGSATRKETSKIDFFDVIDAPEKAYFLGLLASDGFVTSHRAQMELHKQDRDILTKFQEHVPKSHLRTKSKKKPYMLVLSLDSLHCVESLSRYGIVRRKSRSLTIPELPGTLYPHFYRGMFDGDGSIGARQATLTSGSLSFIEGTKAMWEELFSQKVYVQTFDTFYRIILNRRNHKIMDWMYETPVPSMQRKLDLYNAHWKSYHQGLEAEDKKPQR